MKRDKDDVPYPLFWARSKKACPICGKEIKGRKAVGESREIVDAKANMYLMKKMVRHLENGCGDHKVDENKG